MARAISETVYEPMARLSEMSLAEYEQQRSELWRRAGYVEIDLLPQDVAWLEQMCVAAGLQPDSWRVRLWSRELT